MDTRLLPCPGYCKPCCNEHWGTCVFQSCGFPQGICPVVGFLGHTVGLFLVFQRISILFSIVAVSIYIPTNSTRKFSFLHILSRIYCM